MVLLYILIGIVVLYFALRFVFDEWSRKCSECGKFGALVKIDEREIKREPVWKRETKTVRDRTGKEIGTIDEDVLYDRITKKVRYVCTYCGHEEEREVWDRDEKSTSRYR